MGSLLRLTPPILPFANRSSCTFNMGMLRAYPRFVSLAGTLL